MKNNRKNRKLTFIRKKNGIVKYGVFTFMKISLAVIEDKLLFETIITDLINKPDRKLIKILASKYQLHHIKTEVSMINDDFIKDIATLKLSYKVSIIPLSFY